MGVGNEVKAQTGVRNGSEIARRMNEPQPTIHKCLKAMGAKVTSHNEGF